MAELLLTALRLQDLRLSTLSSANEMNMTVVCYLTASAVTVCKTCTVSSVPFIMSCCSIWKTTNLVFFSCVIADALISCIFLPREMIDLNRILAWINQDDDSTVQKQDSDMMFAGVRHSTAEINHSTKPHFSVSTSASEKPHETCNGSQPH